MNIEVEASNVDLLRNLFIYQVKKIYQVTKKNWYVGPRTIHGDKSFSDAWRLSLYSDENKAKDCMYTCVCGFFFNSNSS